MQTIARPKLSLTKRPPAPPAAPPSPPPAAVEPINEARFWILWNPANRRPTKRHPSLPAALAERERLLGLMPDAELLVFECNRVAP